MTVTVARVKAKTKTKVKAKVKASAVRVAVCGAAGRMGRRILAHILADDNARLTGAFSRRNDPLLGADAGTLAGEGECGVLLRAADAGGFAEADAVIDFSTPAGCARSAELCARGKTALVVGVTALGVKHKSALARAAKDIALVCSPNMSAGMNALFNLCAGAAAELEGYDLEIAEAHHNRKKDAPSGTALRLGEILSRARGDDGGLSRRAVFCRQGADAARKKGDIGFSVVRAGDIVGEHRVIFGGAGEQLEILHRALNRDAFAAGALRAAKWAAGADAGFYDMSGVFGGDS